MASLLVRNIDDELIDSLKTQAGAQGISAEALHRRILELALRSPRQRSFIEVLKGMPEVGRDEDFSRPGLDEDRDVFA